MGLRLLEGLLMDDISDYVDNTRLKQLVADGLVWQQEGRIGATATGRPVLNYLIAQLAES
jgi:coproporphyrinogen III oxidase-like Fe-S oxidoreductase